MIRKTTIISISQDWSKNYSMSYSWLEGEPNSSNWSIAASFFRYSIPYCHKCSMAWRYLRAESWSWRRNS